MHVDIPNMWSRCHVTQTFLFRSLKNFRAQIVSVDLFFFSSHSLVIRVLAQVDHDCYQCYTAVKCRTDIPEFGLQFKGGSNPNLHHRIPSTIVPDSKLDMQGVRSVHKHRPPILFLKNWKECSALSGHHQTK